MAYDATIPANGEFVSNGPADIRQNQAAIVNDAIVNAGTVNGLSAGNLSGNIPVSNGTLNVNLNAEQLGGLFSTAFSLTTHIHNPVTSVTNGFMINTDKSKLDTISTGAQVNQDAFSNVIIGSTTIQASSANDTFSLAAGTNISLTPDMVNKKATIAVSGIVANAAIATNATNHIIATSSAHIASAIANISSGNVSSTDVQSAINELDTKKVNSSDIVTISAANKILKLNSDGNLPTNIIGNATTATTFVDGKNSSNFAPSGYGLGTTLPETTIKDIIPVSCFTVVSPSSDPWSLITSAIDSNNFAQITQELSQDNIWARTKYQGTLNSWKQIATVDQLPTVPNDYIVSQSLATNGWRKWNSGFIEQWGSLVLATDSAVGTWNNGNHIITFPLAFPSTMLIFVESSRNGDNASDVDDFWWQPFTSYVNTTSIKVRFGDGANGTSKCGKTYSYIVLGY